LYTGATFVETALYRAVYMCIFTDG
jgi:hypothetical protein